MFSLPFQRNKILLKGKKTKWLLKCRQLKLKVLNWMQHDIYILTPKRRAMCALIPDTNIHLLQWHSQAAALCWTKGSYLGKYAWGEARQCCSCWEVFCIYNSRGISLRIEYSKTEQPAFLYPMVKRDFRKGSFHLTNIYLFLVYGSALHFLYPELHYLITNQKHIGPKDFFIHKQK